MARKGINALGIFPPPRGWSKEGIYCFKRRCVCEGCKYNGTFESIKHCQMKASVLEMVRRFGIPSKDDSRFIKSN